MSRSRFRLVFAIAGLLCILALSTAAWADDLVPPLWRGLPGTTFQLWDFIAPPMGQTPPEMVQNPYGMPMCMVPYGLWQWGNPPHVGRFLLTSMPLVFEIPNSPVPNPSKLILVQVTFQYTGPGMPPLSVRTDLGAPVSTVFNGLPNGWVHAGVYFELPFNPPRETIFISGNDLWVDQVVIDTYCRRPDIPEWSAFALAGPCLLSLIGLRRRRS